MAGVRVRLYCALDGLETEHELPLTIGRGFRSCMADSTISRGHVKICEAAVGTSAVSLTCIGRNRELPKRCSDPSTA